MFIAGHVVDASVDDDAAAVGVDGGNAGLCLIVC